MTVGLVYLSERTCCLFLLVLLILKEDIDPEFRRLQSEAREVRDAAHGSAPWGHGGDRQAGAKEF